MALRYEIIPHDDVRSLNELLSRGWTPVRETPLSEGRALVLLERHGGPPREAAKLAGVPWDVVESCSLFDGLDRDEIVSIIEVCELRSCPAGDTLFVPGDRDAAIHVLLEGRIDVEFPELRGENMVLEGFGPSSLLGESTFFAPADHHATATCVEDSRLLVLARETYDELLQEGSSAARKLGVNAAVTLAERLQSADAWVWELLNEIDSVHVARSWRRYRDRILRR